MIKKDQPTVLNYLLPWIMIILGSRHYVKHGLDLISIIPIALGVFALYLVFFNHALLQRIQDFLTKLWEPVGQLITAVLLTITFCLIFAPVGLFLRLFKKDILNRNLKKNHLSYWIPRSDKKESTYTQQF